MAKIEVNSEIIDKFFKGHDPMERIIKMECEYGDDKVCIIYKDDKGVKKVRRENFYPFVWSKQSVGRELFEGNRERLRNEMIHRGIGCKGLIVEHNDGFIPERMERGYRCLWYAQRPMCYSDFMKFFEDGNVPIYPKQKSVNYGRKDFIAVGPVEQFMISTGKRMFKGYNDYDELVRMEWDLETEGLDPTKDMISQIGIRTNKGFEKIITIEGIGEQKAQNEVTAIYDFFCTINEIKPDVICGHNTENFDWNFINVRLQKNGSDMYEFSKQIFPNGVFKKNKQQVLKLGGETEYYYPTIMWGYNLTDSLFAARRAQALNSNIKKADLKYLTKYLKLNKKNRVYVPGKIINDTWANNTPSYAFNDNDGEWFKISERIEKDNYSYNEDKTKVIKISENKEFDIVTGKYIVERYLLDDLWETDKVELAFNQTNFQVCKMLPVSFERQCTMGTAAVWKLIMLAWSYENNLAIPELIDTQKFTGGLSRLLLTGHNENVCKLDYNSLYPSIILSYSIKSEIDISGVMTGLLEYILTRREDYKEEKKKGEKNMEKYEKLLETENTIANQDLYKKWESYFKMYDGMQSAVKVLGNGFFGSYGSGSVFPHSDLKCAEKTTTIGRQCLRLMIYHFTNIGYIPLVGDSFTGDTPVFVRYKDGRRFIDIKPISEIFDEQCSQVDLFGREYDYSNKEYEVLCRSGWVEPSYIYRHKTDKPIYEVSEGDMLIEVTEDHSLFDSEKKPLKPSEIKSGMKLEYFEGNIEGEEVNLSIMELDEIISSLESGSLKRIPAVIINSTVENKRFFLKYYRLPKDADKTNRAIMQYIIKTTIKLDNNGKKNKE